MQTPQFIKNFIDRFFCRTPTDDASGQQESLPKAICERTKDYKIRKFDIHEFSAWGKETHNLLIPVTKTDFGPLDPKAYIDPSDMRTRIRDSDDRSAYLIEIPKFIREGIIEVYAKAIEFGLIEISKIIQEGDHGDSDGFGIEPNTWIMAYLNLRGEFVSPFSLQKSKSNRNMKNHLVSGINPVDENGEINSCPFDVIEAAFRLPGYFSVALDDNWGLADKNLNLIIPPEYKMIHAELDRLVWVRLHNNLCGILDLKNHFVIPPIYDYLSYIENGDFMGNFKVEKNGITGIIDQNNQPVSGLK